MVLLRRGGNLRTSRPTASLTSGQYCITERALGYRLPAWAGRFDSNRARHPGSVRHQVMFFFCDFVLHFLWQLFQSFEVRHWDYTFLIRNRSNCLLFSG